jgi:predicted RNase H-like HicB family nuclease
MRKSKKIKMLQYTAVFEEAPEGGYVVRIPALGCVTEGETFEEAKLMAADAIQCYLGSLRKHREPFPKESPVEIITSIAVPVRAAR